MVSLQLASFSEREDDNMSMSDSKLRAGLADRITKRANELNLRQADVVRATGAAKSTVNRWYAGAIPRGEHAVKLRKLLRVSQEWLDGTSNSPVVNDEGQLYSVLDKTELASSVDELSSTYVRIPKHNNAADYMVMHRDLLPRDCVPSSLAWIQLQNDTGAPKFSRGDRVVLDKTRDICFVNAGYYAFGTSGSTSVFAVEFATFADEFVIKDGSNNGHGTSISAGGLTLDQLVPSLIGRVVGASISL